MKSVSSIPGSLEGTALGLGSKDRSKKQMSCAKALLSWVFNSTAEHWALIALLSLQKWKDLLRHPNLANVGAGPWLSLIICLPVNLRLFPPDG